MGRSLLPVEEVMVTTIVSKVSILFFFIESCIMVSFFAGMLVG